jgi:hypothetical protein
MGELNVYFPGKADAVKRRRCRGLIERMSRFVNENLARYDLD